MNTRLKEIKKIFKKKGIILKEEFANFKKYDMKDSVTNQFMKVADINDNQYLIRINGKLWPPFTREGEDYNLHLLEDNHINTTVIVNNMVVGFQICRLNDDKNRFNEMQIENKKENILQKIARGIKKFHRIGNFKNNYPIATAINNSVKCLSETEQKKLYPYYGIILAILSMLNSDKKNQVSSHNDLLPSSIYLDKDQVTFVDWEYSAENHRSYDLSLFSIKSSLTPEQEQKLITSYDISGNLNMHYSIVVMKPIVNFLLLLWNLLSKQTNAITTSILLHEFKTSIQNAIYNQSARMLLSGMKFCLFYYNVQHVKSVSDRNLSPKLSRLQFAIKDSSKSIVSRN